MILTRRTGVEATDLGLVARRPAFIPRSQAHWLPSLDPLVFQLPGSATGDLADWLGL